MMGLSERREEGERFMRNRVGNNARCNQPLVLSADFGGGGGLCGTVLSNHHLPHRISLALQAGDLPGNIAAAPRSEWKLQQYGPRKYRSTRSDPASGRSWKPILAYSRPSLPLRRQLRLHEVEQRIGTNNSPSLADGFMQYSRAHQLYRCPTENCQLHATS